MHRDILARIWPEWHVEHQLGKGSYGAVYRAVRSDHTLTSYAAIKVISVPRDPGEINALLTEGRTMDGVRAHLQGIVQSCLSEIQMMQSFKGTANIVGVDDYQVVPKTGSEGWDICIRMELLTPLSACIQNGVLTEREIIRIGIDICSALELCGQKRIIHRDIKPENIFVNEFGNYKLGDFGIARQLEDITAGMTRTGTLNYIAPEVVSGNYDHRADIYSLGLTLYYLLNGNCLPFVNREAYQGAQSAFERRLRGEALPVPRFASPAMADVVFRACAYDPRGRYSSASELKQALLQVAAGTYVLPRPVQMPNQGPGYGVNAPYSRNHNPNQGQHYVSNYPQNQGGNYAGTVPPAAPKKKNGTILIAVLLVLLLLAGAALIARIVSLNGASDDRNTGTSDSDQSYRQAGSPEPSGQPGADILAETEDTRLQEGSTASPTETETTDSLPAGNETISQGGVLAVEAGRDHTVVLWSDGTVDAVGNNGYGQCETGRWQNVIKISAYWDHTMALMADGTVKSNLFSEVEQWTDIVDIAAGQDHAVGLKSDGTVVAAGSNYFEQKNVTAWSDIVAVYAGQSNTVGLKRDGTVVVAGSNNYGQKNGVGSWRDIVSVSLSDSHIVGLKADGTVVASGNNEAYQCSLGSWTDIVDVRAGVFFTIGLRSDGTLVEVGLNDEGQQNVHEWQDIRLICTGNEHTVGVMSDGTLVAVGANDEYQCEVGWLMP